MQEKDKYSIDNLEWTAKPETWLPKALIFIANELHNIYIVLWEMKEK